MTGPPLGHRMFYDVPVPTGMFDFIHEETERFRKGCPNDFACRDFVAEIVEYAKASHVTMMALLNDTAYRITIQYRHPWKGEKPEPLRGMASPNYKRRRLTAKQRKARSNAAKKRLGIPLGFRRIYGLDVPEEFAGKLKVLVSKRINTGPGQNPLRCVPRDLAEEFTIEVFKLLVTHAPTDDDALFAVAQAVAKRHKRRLIGQRKR